MNAKRGTVLQVPIGDQPGLISLENRQVEFRLAGVWQSNVAPVANQTVEVRFNEDGAPSHITAIDRQTVAREHLSRMAQHASVHGARLAVEGTSVLETLRSRIGLATMILACALFIAWFFLPALVIDVGFNVTRSYSMSELLGLHIRAMNSSSSTSFLTLIGVVAVLLPWLAGWLQTRRMQLLHLAPLAALLLGFLRFKWELHELGVSIAKQVTAFTGALGSSPQQSELLNNTVKESLARVEQAIHWGFGYWLCLVLALSIAYIGIHRYRTLSAPHSSSRPEVS